MTPEQDEIIAKLKEIEEQTGRLLDESTQYGGGLARSRVIHIQNLAKYLRSVIGTKLHLVPKSKAD
jgi:hypothetical protein